MKLELKKFFVFTVFISSAVFMSGMNRNNPRPFTPNRPDPDKQVLMAGNRDYFISALLEKINGERFIVEIIGPTKAAVLAELEEEKKFSKWETIIILEETDLKKQLQLTRGS